MPLENPGTDLNGLEESSGGLERNSSLTSKPSSPIYCTVHGPEAFHPSEEGTTGPASPISKSKSIPPWPCRGQPPLYVPAYNHGRGSEYCLKWRHGQRNGSMLIIMSRTAMEEVLYIRYLPSRPRRLQPLQIL